MHVRMHTHTIYTQHLHAHTHAHTHTTPHTRHSVTCTYARTHTRHSHAYTHAPTHNTPTHNTHILSLSLSLSRSRSRSHTHTLPLPPPYVLLVTGWRMRIKKTDWGRCKLQALVYILPSTTAVFSYALGSRKLSAVFVVGATTVVSLLQTTQIKQGVSFIAANKVYTQHK